MIPETDQTSGSPMSSDFTDGFGVRSGRPSPVKHPSKPRDLSGVWYPAFSRRPHLSDERYFQRYPNAQYRVRRWQLEDATQHDIDSGIAEEQLSWSGVVTFVYRDGSKSVWEFYDIGRKRRGRRPKNWKPLWKHLRRRAEEARGDIVLPPRPMDVIGYQFDVSPRGRV